MVIRNLKHRCHKIVCHHSDVIMSAMVSQITSLKIVYSTVYSDVNLRKHQSSESLAFVRGIHRRPVNSPHKGPVTRKMYPFDDVIIHKNRPVVVKCDVRLCNIKICSAATRLAYFYNDFILNVKPKSRGFETPEVIIFWPWSVVYWYMILID